MIAKFLVDLLDSTTIHANIPKILQHVSTINCIIDRGQRLE